MTRDWRSLPAKATRNGEPAWVNPPPRKVAAVTCQQWLRRNDKETERG